MGASLSFARGITLATTRWRSRLGEKLWVCPRGSETFIQLVIDFLQSAQYLRCRLNFSFINHTMEIRDLHVADLWFLKPDPAMNKRKPAAAGAGCR